MYPFSLHLRIEHVLKPMLELEIRDSQFSRSDRTGLVPNLWNWEPTLSTWELDWTRLNRFLARGVPLHSSMTSEAKEVITCRRDNNSESDGHKMDMVWFDFKKVGYIKLGKYH